MRLSEVADRLYALPPGEFVGARDDAARQADRELAAAIKALRKPSASAHLVNQLVRSAPEDVDELLALGAALREAQGALDGAELRRLGGERRRLVQALSLAASRGGKAGDSVDREISATLEAALADEGAAAAVRSGRLIKALRPTGFEGVGLVGAVAVPEELPPVPTSRRLHAVAATAAQVTGRSGTASNADGKAHEHEAAHRAAQQAAQQEAERLGVAERTLVKADAALGSAQNAVDSARAEVHQAEAALERARSALAAAEKARTTLKRDRDAAARARDSAKAALRKAEAALAR